MAYGEYANSGRSFGKCLYQLSKIGIPLRVVESVIFHGNGVIKLYDCAFATVTWAEDDTDTPIFSFNNPTYQELQDRYAQMQRL